MKFDQSFFLPEVREGFYISTVMKRFWAAQMEILSQLIEVCMLNDIKIFMDYGSLLGTVRHGGFIPWDDDIDVAIFRKDQKRLYRLLMQEYGDKWELMEAQDVKYLQPWYRINNSCDLLFDEADLKEYHGCPYSVGVDIYILDNPPSDENENEIVKNLFEIVYGLCYDKEVSEQTKAQALTFMEECFDLRINTDDITEIKRILLTIAQELMATYDENENGILMKLDAGGYGTRRYRAEWFSDMIWMPFENMYVPVPVGYEQILELCFGSGYMNVVMGRALHDYPGFKEQEAELNRRTGRTGGYQVDKAYLIGECKARRFDKKPGRTIVFLPYQTEKWKYLEPFWEMAVADPENKVYVIPLKLYVRDELGMRAGLMEDKGNYPENVSVLDPDETDLDDLDIDEIYIQQPYDGLCDAFDIDESFYSKALRNRCKRLVYVPDFELMDITSKDNVCYKTFEYFVAAPGVVHADETVVKSEDQRKLYMDFLCGWTGEDTREFWSEKLILRERYGI